MTRNTHIIGGVTLALALEKICFPQSDLNSFIEATDIGLFYISTMLGSLIPDIDKKNSCIGKKFPKASKFINKVFGHRTITHSITFVFMIYYLMKYLNINIGITLGITLGILSHILLDLLNFQGVTLLYPSTTKYSVGVIRTSGTFEMVFRWMLIMVFFILFIYK